MGAKFGETAYDSFKKYLIDNIGDSSKNRPHLFAMFCNNYALLLSSLSDLIEEDKDMLVKSKALTAHIHMEGYQISPFIENLENAGTDFYNAQMWNETIQCYNDVIKEYSHDLDPDDIQNCYWFIISAAIKKHSPKEVKQYYSESKELYCSYGPGAIEATKYFAISTQDYFRYHFENSKEYEEITTKTDWLWEQKTMKKKFPLEYGIAMYGLGMCHIEKENKEEAVKALRLTVDLLQDDAPGFYYDKSIEAAKALTELGENSGHKYEHRSPSMIKKLWYTLIKPFQIIALLIMYIFYFLTGIRKEESKGSKRDRKT